MANTVYFISHAPSQRAFAYALAFIMRQRGETVILYEFDFPEDADFVEEISDAVVDADAVICLLSSAFVESNWCVKEFALAHRSQKLIPILIETCDTKKLPPISEFIDLRGLDEKNAIATFEREIKTFVENLSPLPLTYEEAFAFIERSVITLPLFAGGAGFRAEFWQHHAYQFASNVFQGQNVEVIELPQVIQNERQANKVLKAMNVDIVLYGAYRDEYIDIGFVASRGWNLRTHEILQLPENLKFRIIGENFGDLSCVLKVAFGNLERARNRYEQAAICFTEAIAGIPLERAQNLGMQYFYVYRGHKYLDLKQHAEAIADFTEAIRLDPQFALAYNNRGFVYDQLGQHTEAIADYTEAIRLDPQFALAYNNRGAVYNALGQHTEAIADYTEAIRLDPQLMLAYNNRGSAYDSLGQYAEAVADCTEAIRLDPQYARAYNNRGSAYNALGQHAEAVADCTEAIRLDPQLAAAYNNRGSAYNALGQYAEAVTDFTETIRLDPQYARAYNNRGSAYRSLGQYAEAIADFTETIRLVPQYAAAYSSRGFAYHSLGQCAEAIADYSEAIRLNPQDAASYHNRGFAYHSLDQHAEAIADFTEAIRLDPKFAVAFNNRGSAYHSLGQHAEAIADFTEAIRLDSQVAIAYANRGNVYQIMGMWCEALNDFQMVKKLANLFPDIPEEITKLEELCKHSAQGQ